MTQEYNVDEAQIGRILHFVIHNHGRSQCRPAIVVEDWPSQGKPGYVNLCVFPDGTNDGAYGTDNHKHGVIHPTAMADIVIGGPPHPPHKSFTDNANLSLMVRWETSVLPNHAVKAVRSWHWPRECKSLHEPAIPFVNEAKETFHHNHAEGVQDIHNCTACSYASRAKSNA